jgi:hypothetical protein
MRRVEAVHVMRRVAGPALSADVLIEAAIPVGDDVQTGDFLLSQVDRQGIHVLLAEAADHHRVEKRLETEVFRIPARTGQRPCDRRRQHLACACVQHDEILRGADLTAAGNRRSGHVLRDTEKDNGS